MRHKHEENKIAAISTPASFVFKLMDWSCRFDRYNFSPDNSPAIYAIWHGLQYCLGGLYPRNKINILISNSNDGEIIARIVHSIGFSTIRGSMGRGGTKATMQIIKTLEEGENVAYTVDGPKGPGFKVKKGIIKIAQMSQKPIIPVSAEPKFKIEFSSWDKYQLPIVGSRIALTCGDPIYVPKDLSDEEMEEYRLKLENKLFSIKEEAESKFKNPKALRIKL